MKKEKALIAYARKIKTEEKYFKRKKIPKKIEVKKEIEYRIVRSYLIGIDLICIKDSRFSRFFTLSQIQELIKFLNGRIDINDNYDTLNLKEFLIAKKNQINKINLPALYVHNDESGEWYIDDNVYYNYSFIYPKSTSKLSKLIKILQNKLDITKYSRNDLYLYEMESPISFEI